MTYDMDLSFNYLSPTKVIFGNGMLSELPMEITALGRKAFLVSDEGLATAGLVDAAQKIMGNLLAGTFAEVPQDSGMDVVDHGAALAMSSGADVVVSLGGGSVIDTAKGISILMTEGGSMRDFQGMQMLTRPQTPHIVIPTTAGTGSEVTAGAVILDKQQGQKIINFENHNIPRVAILDPQLTQKLPPELTASTGMDAMTHAIESYTAQQRNPISDAVALHAIRLIAHYLPLTVKNGNDLVARGQMQVAALLAGWAFSNAMVGLVHAMAHSLGAVCRLPHGLANAILLPHVMAYNLEEIPELSADIAQALGVDLSGLPPIDAGKAGIEQMKNLLAAIGLPTSLKSAGVDESKFDACSELSMSDGSIIYNAKMIFEPEEVRRIYQEAF